MIYYTRSATETEAVGRLVAEDLDSRGIRRAAIAMRGELGVGKTAFTRGFASYFGISGVKSPTYTVVNEYRGTARIFHFDMYRISDADDLYSIGYDEYIESDGYSVIEWSENITDLLPDDVITVTILRDKDDESGRKIEVLYENSGI